MFLITYDITKDKTRVKISKILLDYGQRVQYSVFESDATEEELGKIVQKLKNYIDKDTDSIKIYNLCGNCIKKTITLGIDKTYYYPDSMVV